MGQVTVEINDTEMKFFSNSMVLIFNEGNYLVDADNGRVSLASANGAIEISSDVWKRIMEAKSGVLSNEVV